MALDYILNNTGPEVQERLDQVPVTQVQLTDEIANREAADSALRDSIGAETTRAEGAEQALDGRITSVEGKVPQDATPQNPLADKDWVADSIATATDDFITASVNNLINYYLKSETYTREEVQQIIGSIKQFKYQSVPELPTASAATTGIIYLVPSADPQSGNVKDEYITVYQTNEMGMTYYSWEQIGSTAIDLADYYTKSQTDAAITADLNTALASYSTTAQMNTAIETAIANLDLSDTYETKGAAAAVVGDAGEDYNTLAKIEEKLLPVEEASGDKVYEAGSGKGLGRKNLPLNSIGNKNLLSQSMINQANTVYVIQNDYEIGSDGSVDLRVDPISVTIGGVNYYCKEVSLNAGETILLTTTGSAKIIINDGGSWVLCSYNYYTALSNTTIRLGAVPTSQISTINYIKTGGSITIPANCTLKFDGGSIGGGTLVANGAKIEGVPSFNNMTDIQGVFKMDVAHAENFGFGGDDDTKLLGFLFDMAASGVDVVLEEGHQYKTNVRDWYRNLNRFTVPSDWNMVGGTNAQVSANQTSLVIGGVTYKYGAVNLHSNYRLRITDQQYTNGVRIARLAADGTSWYIDKSCTAEISGNETVDVGGTTYAYKNAQVSGVGTIKVAEGGVLLRKSGGNWVVVDGNTYTTSVTETFRVATTASTPTTVDYTIDTGTTVVVRKEETIRLCVPQSSGTSTISYTYFFEGYSFYDDGHAIRYYNNLNGFYLDGNGATILMSTNKTFMNSYSCAKLLRFCDCSNVTIKNVTLTGDVCQIKAPGGLGVEPIFAAGDADNFNVDIKGKHLRQPFCYGTYNSGSLSARGVANSTIIVETEDCGYGMEINGASNSVFKVKFNIGHRGIYLAAATNCEVTSVGKNVNTMAAILFHATLMEQDGKYVMTGSSNNTLRIEDIGTNENTEPISATIYAGEDIGLSNRYSGDSSDPAAISYTCATAVYLSCACYNGIIDDYMFERENNVLFTGNTLKYIVHEECMNYSVYPVSIGPLDDRYTENGYIWDKNYAPYPTWELKMDCEIKRFVGWAEWNKNNNGHSNNNYNVFLSVYGNNDMSVTIDGNVETNDTISYYTIALPPSNNKKIKLSSSSMQFQFTPWISPGSTSYRKSVNESAVMKFVRCKNVYFTPLGNPTPYDLTSAKYTNLVVDSDAITNDVKYPINITTTEAQLKTKQKRVTLYKDITSLSNFGNIFSSTAAYGISPYQIYDFIVYTSSDKTVQFASDIIVHGDASKIMRLPAGSHKFTVWTTLENNLVKVNIGLDEPLPWIEAGAGYVLNARVIKDGKIVTWNGSKFVEYDGATASVLRKGTTAQRPAGNDIYVGFEYFDTDLGKTIYASAIAVSSPYTVTWVDADGVIAGAKKAGEITERPSTAGLKDGFTYLVTDQWTPTGGAAQDPGPIYYVDLTSAGGHPSWITVNGDTFEDTALPQRE